MKLSQNTLDNNWKNQPDLIIEVLHHTDPKIFECLSSQQLMNKILLPDCKFAADATGVNENLIIRFRTILIAINSSRRIDIPKFRSYAYETAKLYIHHYHWYFMPPSVHKVLLHGADLMDCFDLPIGTFSEEAQEARNKDFRNVREFNSRKSSRANTNEDILHWLLISSDPVITSLRTFPRKKLFEFDRNQTSLFISDQTQKIKYREIEIII